MNKEDLIDLIADLYEELEISEFGFDLEKAIRKLDINLIPYSSYENKELLVHYDEDGFTWINPRNDKVEIFFNDRICPKERIKFTLPHELGHICLGHNLTTEVETYREKSEADMFAREFYCPQAFMINYKLKTASDLVSAFKISYSYANILLIKIEKRKDEALTKAERRLIKIFETNKRKSK